MNCHFSQQLSSLIVCPLFRYARDFSGKTPKRTSDDQINDKLVLLKGMIHKVIRLSIFVSSKNPARVNFRNSTVLANNEHSEGGTSYV